MLGIQKRSTIAKSILWSVMVSVCTPLTVSADFLEEVIVTAKKREESLQDVSLAMTAFSADTLKDIGLGHSNDLGELLPGVEISSPSGNQQAKTFIRGSGAVDFAANTQTTVGVYMDEVYLHNTFMHTMQIFDLERIEVLRGPQGTLYGRNATGGAINYISAKPTEEMSGYVRAGYGNYDAVQLEGAVSGGITDTLAGRIAATYSEGGGWMEGRTTIPGTVGGDDFNEVDFYSWRGMLEWTPQENIRALWTISGAQDHSDAYSYQHAGSVDPVTFGLCDATIRDDCIDFGRFDGSGAQVAPNYQDPDGQEERGDPTKGDFDLQAEVDYETIGTNLRVEWDLERFTITSITSYNKFQRYQPGEEDGSPNKLTHNFYRHQTDAWSQELRATSTGDGQLDWLVGLYYAEDDLDAYNIYEFFVFSEFTTFQTFDQEQESFAVFANAGYQFNDQFKLNAGLRYTKDDVALNHNSDALDAAFPAGFGFGFFPFDPGTSGEESYEDVSWKVGIDYTPNENWLIYGSVGTGYKSGGINVGFGDPGEFNIYQDEKLLAVEGGFKSTLWDGRARLNVSAFYYDYEDLQVFDQQTGAFGIVFVIGNAPKAEYYGFETEFLVNPVEGLDLIFNVSHLNTEFGTFLRPLTGEDLTGNNNVYSPEWKFSGVARYEWATPSLMDGKMAVSFNYSWRDDVFHSIENRSDIRSKDYWLANARLSWYSQDENIEVAFWGKNLSDTVYRRQSFDFSGSGFVTLVPNTPRTFGGQIIYSW